MKLNLFVHYQDKAPDFIPLPQDELMSVLSGREQGTLSQVMDSLLVKDLLERVESIAVYNFRPSVRSLYVRVDYVNGSQSSIHLNTWQLDRMSGKVETLEERVSLLVEIVREYYKVDVEESWARGFQISEEASIFSTRSSTPPDKD